MTNLSLKDFENSNNYRHNQPKTPLEINQHIAENLTEILEELSSRKTIASGKSQVKQSNQYIAISSENESSIIPIKITSIGLDDRGNKSLKNDIYLRLYITEGSQTNNTYFSLEHLAKIANLEKINNSGVFFFLQKKDFFLQILFIFLSQNQPSKLH